MTSETDGGSSTNCASEAQEHSRISYSREFLLSISLLEICKKLPSGFDQLILSEFEDTSHGIQDCQRVPGSLPLQGLRRTDYSSSAPTRGDSSSHSRGNYGRWESRSSGQSDRDNDSQSDWDSDSNRRYSNQVPRTWQSSEHDGLLGSGSFPRLSAYASGISAPKVQVNNNYQSNKTNGPYPPPRPYKAGATSRRDADAINDETFGSIECTGEDRVEEERRRRASFELMRKEQQKVLQEKQKTKLEKHKTEDILVLLEDNKDDRTFLEKNSEADGMTTQPLANSDPGKSSFPSQNPPVRPRVPPGFKTTVLDKNSGSNLNHSCVTKNSDNKPNDMLGSKAIQSLKFAQWFMEEDRKSTEDSSSSRPNDLFALIGDGDKTRTQDFGENVSECFPSEHFNQSPVPTSKVTSHIPSAPLGVPEPMYDSSKREAAPSILTCENLEHKMLSEFSEKSSNLQPISQVCGTNRLDTEEQHVNVDSNASQHLLSLLQKGPDLTNMTGKGSTGTEARDGHDEFTVQDRSKEEDTKDVHASGKAVTLETLFGTAFMKELQSAQAPVSIHRNSIGSGLIDEVNSRHQSEMVSKSEAAEFHLPAENLFSAHDHSNPQVSMVMPAGILSKGDLATGSVAGSDERYLMSLEGLPFPRVSHDQSEIPLYHRLAQPSSPQFHPLQMSQGKPLFHPMDSGPAHLNAQIFNGRESMALREAPGRQFAGNMMRPPFHHPNGGLTGSDLPAHHPMLQQMQMTGNNPPHLLYDRLRGVQVPSHLSNQAASIMQDVNRIQPFPFVPQQVNISGRIVQMPDAHINSRNNHPEAMQRLVERQLGAPKQIHPFYGGDVQAMYSHKLDMGLRYR